MQPSSQPFSTPDSLTSRGNGLSLKSKAESQSILWRSFRGTARLFGNGETNRRLVVWIAVVTDGDLFTRHDVRSGYKLHDVGTDDSKGGIRLIGMVVKCPVP